MLLLIQRKKETQAISVSQKRITAQASELVRCRQHKGSEQLKDTSDIRVLYVQVK